MSLEASGGSPEFGFRLDPPQTYSHEKVGNHVVWPLINMLWRDNWRENSYVGNDMRVAHRGDFKGQAMEVVTAAYTEMGLLLDEDNNLNENREIVSTAVMDIHEIVTDQRRSMILTRVAMQDDGVWEYDEEDLIAKVASTYRFDSNGYLEIERDQIAETVDGESIWHIETFSPETALEIDKDNPETAITQVMSSQLFEHDMDLIEAGLYVFRAPDAIVKALEKIKARPTTRYC